jgi:ADP-heptose:LPS heptosyltransferase
VNLIKKDEVSNIVITRTDRMGDVILTLPLISFTKKLFPEAKIFFLVNDYVKDLVNNYPGIDEIIIYDKLNSFSKKYSTLKTKDIDLVIFAKPEFELALLFFLLRTKCRLGTGYRWYSFLFNFKVFEHRKISDKHESDYNLNLLWNFFPDEKFEKKFHFNYSDSEKNQISEKLKVNQLNLSDNFIIIHPGSGNSAKDLPVGILKQFAKKFIKHFTNFKIVLTGNENEKELTKQFRETDSELIVDLAGQLSIRELMILIDNSKLFISSSTGPIHLAGALNKKIIGFYPNQKPSNEERWKPLSEYATILKPIDANDNMNDITPELIIETVEKLLK